MRNITLGDFFYQIPNYTFSVMKLEGDKHTIFLLLENSRPYPLDIPRVSL